MKKFDYLIFQRKSIPYFLVWFILFLSISSFTARAQTLKGRITTDAGKEIPGASILVKGTNIGTVANSSGEYSFNNLPKNATIVITSIGYIKQEISVGTKTVIDVTLLTDTRELGEVIVVGYGTQKKRDITGSVVSVTEATLKEVPAPDLLNTLKGRAAGVSIVSNGSTPR